MLLAVLIAPKPVAMDPDVSAPTPVSDEAVTPLARVEPVSVPAAAGTVMLAVPSKLTPLMVRAVWSAVAVPALPETEPEMVDEKVFVSAIVWLPVVYTPFVTVPAWPLMPPEIVDDTVSPLSVPTLVSDELVTLEARVVPVSVPAAAGTVMFDVPSKLTPLMVRAVWSAVAVPALPV